MTGYGGETGSETVVKGELGRETRHAAIAKRDENPPWTIGDRLGEFVLEEYLDRGSSGFVYRVQEVRTGQRHALKILRPGSSEDLVRNKCGFRRMRTLSHPGLVRVHRIYRLDQFIGLTMEEVNGETLANHVKGLLHSFKEERWTILLRLMRQYAAALAHMHSRGLLHRDIKPQNLMVDDKGNGRIVDYGLVGTFDPQEDPNGFRHYIVGSPDYMPPEACWDHFYVPAGDVFGLGISMLQVSRRLQGDVTLPRSGDSRREDGQLITDAIDSLNDSVPLIIREACREMLSSSPSERPTALEISRLGLPIHEARAMDLGVEFFGRDTELSQLRSWVRLIANGGTGRLHIRGESGVGKTKLIDRLLDEHPANGWIQIFRARCLPREDQSLQAFDQIIDEIVGRFMKSDREPIQMDVGSASVLLEAFPQLECMINADREMSELATASERMDALEAGVRLSKSLARLGPLILIVDDVQWADQDSLNVLDALQSFVGECFGLITVSRGRDNLQKVSADATLELDRLSEVDSKTWLQSIVRRWNVDVTDDQLDRWVSTCEGCPLDLTLLADSLKPGGMMTVQPGGDGDLKSFDRQKMLRWRIDSLSVEARRTLEMICLAGRETTYGQLAQVTGLGASIEEAVSELAHERLVTDHVADATGYLDDNERVQVVHAKINEIVTAVMPVSRQTQGHLAWSRCLRDEPGEQQIPAQIAGHLFDAESISDVVPYAIAAAEEAEKRLAMTEAARWREKVVPLLGDEERRQQLLETARCYDEADLPAESARCYFQSAELTPDAFDRTDLELKAVRHLIRCGQIEIVRKHLGGLCQRLGVPRPKGPWGTKFSLAAKVAQLKWYGDPLVHVSKPVENIDGVGEASRRDRQRLELCLNLTRPLSLLDNHFAAELSLTGAIAVSQRGTEAEILHNAAGASVFGSYRPGRSRRRAHKLLDDLLPRFQAIKLPHLWGDYHSSKMFQRAFEFDWAASIEPAQQAVAHYHADDDSRAFEIAHTRWVEVWASFYIGQVDHMRSVAMEMYSEATSRNDRFGWMVTTGGYGITSWLAKNQVEAAQSIARETASTMKTVGPQWTDLFAFVADCQRDMYLGNWTRLLDAMAGADRRWLRPMCRQNQFIQILRSEILVRAMLGRCEAIGTQDSDRKSSSEASLRKAISRELNKLSKHRLPCTDAMTSYFKGRLQKRLGQAEAAKEYFKVAGAAAEKLGLVPLRLASEDHLHELTVNRTGIGLVTHLDEQGVTNPERFARLYV